MQIAFGLLLLVVIIGGLAALLRRLWMQSAVQQRWEDLTQPVVATNEADQDDRWWLSRWLFLAGFRRPGADVIFIAVTLTLLFLGTLVAVGIRWSGLQRLMEVSIVQVPGGVGETFLPVIWVAPWLLLILLAATPWLVVRAVRRKRVELVDQDLPMALELLSTLSEAGLGFDAALSRILKTRLAGRPLAEELRRFQADLLAGRPRTQSLRRFSARLDIASVSVFTSAMVQAEQLGMGIARVLRLQADDVRARRRERSIAFANALPTKRVIPLVVCFLPGLFVWTLGPAFVQLFKMAETFIQTR
ncbi:MAG: type II secretion system F family protein [Planctomycetaceae bacterium]